MAKRIEVKISKDKVVLDIHAGDGRECDDATLLLQAILEGLGVDGDGKSEKKPPIPEASILKQNQTSRNGN